MIKYSDDEKINTLLSFLADQKDCFVSSIGTDSYSISMTFWEGDEGGYYVSYNCPLGKYTKTDGLELQDPSFYMAINDRSGLVRPMLYDDWRRSPEVREDYSDATQEELCEYLAKARKVKKAYNAIKDILSVQ